MNRIKTAIIAAAAISLISSCVEPKTRKTDSYIWGYYDVDAITLTTENVTVTENEFIKIDVRMPEYHQVAHVWDKDQSLIDRLHRGDKDTHYIPSDVPDHIKDLSCRAYAADDFTDISVKTVNRWDGQHPAGSSLNDIAFITGFTVGPFINNGYEEYDKNLIRSPFFEKSYTDETSLLGERYPLDNFISRLPEGAFHLLGDGYVEHLEEDYLLCSIYLPRKVTGPVQISVTVAFESGKTIIAEIEPISPSASLQ